MGVVFLQLFSLFGSEFIGSSTPTPNFGSPPLTAGFTTPGGSRCAVKIENFLMPRLGRLFTSESDSSCCQFGEKINKHHLITLNFFDVWWCVTYVWLHFYWQEKLAPEPGRGPCVLCETHSQRKSLRLHTSCTFLYIYNIYIYKGPGWCCSWVMIAWNQLSCHLTLAYWTTMTPMKEWQKNSQTMK